MEESQGEIIRKKISNFLDNNINLNDSAEKKKLFEEIQKENPSFKKGTTHASISKFLKSEQAKRNIQSNHKTKPRYDESLNPKTKDGSTRIKNQNPLVEKNDSPKSELEVKQIGNYPVTTCESVGSMAYSAFSISDEDMESLTEQERKDVGEMLKPLLDRYANGERGAVIISLGAVLGLFINKKRQARAIRKKRKEESNQPNKETTQEFPREPTSLD